ncbi:DUF732 domain-containing protein [Paeniglutamicibacter sp. NPDC012692]|uniref:DUF732 domain-containing protein n=1 Tax=Paeniglutamicibacter sp. NPDC012692 TaxID=3364388 RepID=UPI0036C7F1A3
MSKKLLWILISVVALVLVATVSVVSVNAVKASKIEAERKETVREAQRIADRNNLFAAGLRRDTKSFSELDPQLIIRTGKYACESMTNGTAPNEVAYTMFKDDTPVMMSSKDSGTIVSRSVETLCPERGPVSASEINDYVSQRLFSENEAERKAAEEASRKKATSSGFYKDISSQIALFGEKGKKWSVEFAVDQCFWVDDATSVENRIQEFEREHNATRSDAIGAVAVSIKYACPESYDFVEEWQLNDMGISD